MARRYRQTSDYVNDLARMIRAGGRRVAGADPADLAQLDRLHQAVNAAVIEAVRGQRSQGITWESIGEAFGMTKQGAIMRWAQYMETVPAEA